MDSSKPSGKLQAFFALIRFEHSIFALPFAYLGLFLAERKIPPAHIFWWVTLAMVALRTAAMCVNRLVDRKYDQMNPRTAYREKLITTVDSFRIASAITGSMVVYFFACFQLNLFCFLLSPIPAVFIFAYPFLKKITWCSHFVLGMILGMAPYGGWLAGKGYWSWEPLIIMCAVTAWVSAFDMLYALQDLEFDRTNQLRSFPVQFGIERTVSVSAILHGVTIALLGWMGISAGLGFCYWVGWIVASLFIFREHMLVRKFGLEKINEVFFNMNAVVSIVIFASAALDLVFKAYFI